MCGRYTYLFTWKQLHHLMRLLEVPSDELTPRYNVAPTQLAPVVRQNSRGDRAGAMLEWGLIPRWAGESKPTNRPCNARGESLFEKPMFKTAARERRCLVPASGFYEWQTLPGRAKRPHLISRQDQQPFCFAGIWEPAPAGSGTDTFVIITTSPNPLMSKLHDRMPVIVPPEEWSTWLSAESSEETLQGLIRPYSGDDFAALAVGTGVNSVKRDDPTLICAVREPDFPQSLFE